MRVLVMGMDGYLGWPLAMHLVLRGHEVGGVDNFSRRRNVEEVHSWSAVPIASMEERLAAFNDYGEGISFVEADLTSVSAAYAAIRSFKPEAIVHLGEIPSAPYSMIDADHCNYTQTNNLVSTTNILFAMKSFVPDCQLVKLGTMGEYGCYDDETETFTENGWKLFKDLLEEDRIASRIRNSRLIRFVKPTSRNEYDFEGQMYYVRGRRINLFVTPNHRMFTAGRSKKGQPLRLEYISDIERKDRVYDIGCEWEGEDQERFLLPDCDHEGQYDEIPMDIWLDFLGWYLSEGCVPERKDRPSSYRTEIRQNLEGLEPIIHAADALCGFTDLNKSIYEEKDGSAKVEIWGKKLAIHMKRYGKSGKKFIDREIKQLPPRRLKILLNSLLRGDGWPHRIHRDNYRYYSKSKQLADDVQEIALKCGLSANISLKDGGYQVNICRTTFTHVGHMSRNDGWEQYKGKVYCVNVGGDGIILVRRKGKPVWCGNTPNLDIPEGFFEIEYKGRKDTLHFPKKPGSFYHASKCHDSINIEFACRVWGLRSTDIMQGVVHGVDTAEIHLDPRLRTRFDFDECWGTALNRFCAQAVIGMDLTPYGKGWQTRGYIALRDSIQCMTLAIENPPARGEYRVFNQFDECYSVNQLAQHVVDTCRKLDIPTKPFNIANPRIEAEEHYYNPDHEKLHKLGFRPTKSLDDELENTLLILKEFKSRIEAKRNHILPTIYWNYTRLPFSAGS